MTESATTSPSPTRSLPITLWNLLKFAFRRFFRSDCTMMAAALAYYAMFSIPALLLLVILIAGMIWGVQLSSSGEIDLQPDQGQVVVKQYVEQELSRILGENGKNQLINMMGRFQSNRTNLLTTLVSTGILLVGATGFLTQLQTALNKVWDVSDQKGSRRIWQLAMKRIFSFGLIILLVVLLILSLGMTSLLTSFVHSTEALFPGTANYMALISNNAAMLFVVTLFLAALFHWLPDTTIYWRDVWIGALLTAVLLLIGKMLFGWYLGTQGLQSYEKTAGAFMLLLTWVYYSSLILLFGAVFTRVCALSREGMRESDHKPKS